MNNSILFVDDEANILSSYRRTLHNKFTVVTQTSANEALSLLASSPKDRFAVIVSDFKMPEMNGLEFLKKAHDIVPNTVRVMLTGYADIETSIAAINEGEIFRFLTKPCPPVTLVDALNHCTEQYQLIMAEKELLRGTLQGSIKLMTELLSMTNPLAFGQSERIKRMVSQILKLYPVKMSWMIEVAAMLSQIGCSALPEELVQKVNSGTELTEAEEKLYATQSDIGKKLLQNIPRLEQVADIIGSQDNRGVSTPVGSKIICLAKQYDILVNSGVGKLEISTQMRKQEPHFGKNLLDVFDTIIGKESDGTVTALPILALRTGMIVDQNVVTVDNLLLINRGQELTDANILRLKNYGNSCGVKEPIRIIFTQ